MISSLILLGGFYEFTSCIIFCGLSFFILLDYYKNKRKFVIGINALCIAAITVAYLLSIVFAVDRGMAFLGFIKYMPLIPLVLLVSQIEVEERTKLIRLIPLMGVGMTVVSALLSFSETISSFLNVNGNLSGFFQYPNTFALFLTIGLIVLADDLGTNKKEWISKGFQAVVLLGGIIASGSRTAVIILIVLYAILLYRRDTRKLMIYALIVSVVTLLIVIVIALVSGSLDSIQALFNISGSTFYGRILYVLDALPLVLKNPLGLGYWGYFFTQGQIQTGVYAILYVHNDFVQLFLDAGWIAGAGLIVVLVRSIKSKDTPQLFKLILVFMSIYMMFDFHLQYISIFMILLLCLDYNVSNEKHVILEMNKVIQVISGIMIILSLYMGIALGMKYLGLDDYYIKLYPYDTEIKLENLENAETLEESNAIADDILKYNTSVSAVYGAKAEYAYSEYDFQAVSEYKLEEIRLSPYTRGNYRELIDMMNVGMLMYEEVGDTVSTVYCRNIITNVPNMLEVLNENTSYLGTMIDASPYLTLSDEYIAYIEELEEE